MGGSDGAGIRSAARRPLQAWPAVVLALLVAVGGVGGITVAQDGATEIEDWHDLDAIRDDPGGDFVLVTDLNETTAGYDEVASPTANGGAGFEPIGNRDSVFTGTFDGQGHTISDLHIDRPDTDNVGLFGMVFGSDIRDVSVVGADITGGDSVGALVGYNQGTVRESSATATVSGDSDVGGLVGENKATVSDSYANGDVTAADFDAGGLVGSNGGTVNESYATGNVTTPLDAGGLVGTNLGTIETAYATGNVSGDSGGIGGLVGQNGFDAGDTDGYINETYATGHVSGDTAGGLVGDQQTAGSETKNSYWDTVTTGHESAIGDASGITTTVSGLTTVEMQGTDAETSMAAFDFESTWKIAIDGYPTLQESEDDSEPEEGMIAGTITAEGDGAAIEDATVKLLDSDGEAVSETATDANGEYSFVVTPGTYDLSVTADGYESKTVGPVDVESGSTTTQDVEVAGDELASFEVESVRDAILQGDALEVAFADAVTVDGQPFDGDATLVVDRPGDDPQTTTVSFTNGAATVEVLSGETTADVSPGEYTDLAVELEANTSVADAYDVEIVDEADDAFFAVDVDEGASDLAVVEGENVTAVATVENIGGITGAGTVRVQTPDRGVDADVELGPGETTTVELELPVTLDDVAIEVWTHDGVEQHESEIVSIEVVEAAPSYTVAIDEAASDLAVAHGENATVAAEVENTGPVSGTGEVSVTTGAADVSAAFDLESGGATAVELEVPIAIGDDEVEVVTVDESAASHDSDVAPVVIEEVDAGALDWAFETTGFVESSPTVVNGTAYVGDGSGNVHAIDIADGEALWSASPGGTDQIRTSAQVVDGTVYVGDTGGSVHALDAATGDAKWEFEAGEFVNSDPTRVGDTVYAGDGDGTLYAIDATEGTERWRFSTGDEIQAAPTVVDGIVYVGSHDDSVYAVDAESGDEVWSVETGLWINSAVTVVDGTAYVGSDDSSLYALDAEDGTLQWEFDDPDAHVISATTVHDGVVYVGTDDTTSGRSDDPTAAVLYAVDAATGDALWNASIDRAGAEDDWQFHAAPTVADGVVYVPSVHGAVYGVDAGTGDVVWAYDTDGAIWSSPTVVDGVLYVGSDDGSLHALDVPGEGSSVDSRVELGTLGHHDVWAANAVDHPLEGVVTDAATGAPIRDVAVTVSADGDPVETAVTGVDGHYEAALDAGTYTLTFEHERYEPATVEVTIAEDEMTVEDVALDPLPGEIAVELADVDPVVVEGEEATATVTLTNPGGASADGSVVLEAGGETRDDVSVSLEHGDETTVDLSWATEPGDAGEYEATIASEDHSVTVPIVVIEDGEAYYDVTVESIDPFPAGDAVNVTVSVENLGAGTGDQNITLSVVNSPAEVVDVHEGLELAPGENTTLDMTWETAWPDVGNYDVFAASEDAETSTDAAVVETREPNFDVAIDALDPIVRPGDEIAVTASIENVGARGDIQTIALVDGDEVLDSAEVALDGAENGTVELVWETDEADEGTGTIAVESANDSDATSVAVLVGDVSYSDVSVSEQDVALGSYVTVTATVTNDDDSLGTEYVAPVAVGTGVVDEAAGEVAAGGSQTVTFAVPMDEPGDLAVQVGDAAPTTVSVSEAWTQHGLGDGNRGHGPALSGPTVAVEERWNVSIDDTVTDPIVVDGVAYVGAGDGAVRALDVETGDEAWRHDEGVAITATPALDNGRLFVGTADGIVALGTDGSEAWRRSLGEEVGGIGVADGVLYVGTADGADGTVQAIDAASGDVLWTFDATGAVTAPPAVVGDRVYVGADGSPGALHALDASEATMTDDERERWTVETDGGVVGTPAYAGGTLYVGTTGGSVLALDADAGAERWADRADAAVRGSPAVADGTVYVGRDDGEVVALDAETGTEAWTHHTTGTGIESSPAVVDDTVYLGVVDAIKDHRVVGIDAATGQERWHHAVETAPTAAPAVIGDAVYVGTDGGLFALEERVEGAILQVQTVSLNRTEVEAGSAVTINTTVTNAGTETGEFEIVAECQLGDVLMDCGVWVVEVEPDEVVQLSSEDNELSLRGEWFVVVDGRSSTRGPFHVRSPGTLNGTVTDATTGEPIANTTVTAEIILGEDERRVTRARLQTDENGEYEVRLRQNVYAVRFTHDRYVTDERLYVPVRWGQTTTLDVELEEKRWITGVLERPDGEPAANHTVSVDEMVRDEWSVVDWTITDETGAFELGVPGNRTYALVATEQHYTLREDRLYFPHNDVADLSADRAVAVEDVPPGEEIDVGTVQFPDGYNVNVTVVDANGDPVVGADVVWRDVNEPEGTFGEFHWIGTGYDGKPGESFDDPGVELPAGLAEVNVSTPWGESVTTSVELSEDVDLVFEPTAELDAGPEFVVADLAVEEPAFAGDTVNATATIENVGTTSGTQTVSLGVPGTDAAVEEEVSLLSGENATLSLAWDSSTDDVGDRGFVAETENETASGAVTLIAPGRPHFRVRYDWAELVQEGNTTTVTATVENLGEDVGVQDVRLLIEDEVVDTRSKLALGPGDRTRITLAWDTEVGDAGVHNVTVASDDHAPIDTIEVLGPPEPHFDVEITDAPAAVEAGEPVAVTATVVNVGREGGAQTVALTAADGAVLDEEEVTLDAARIRRPAELTFRWETELGDAGAYELTVASEDDAASTDVEVLGTNATAIAECTVIETPGVYRLATDLVADQTGATCVEIVADDVYFDGMGRAIAGGEPVAWQSRDVAIGVTGADGVTVTNVTTVDWYALGRGVALDGASNVTVRGVVAENNTFGVTTNDVDGFALEGIRAADNARAGIQVYHSRNGTVRDSRAVGNAERAGTDGWTNVYVREDTTRNVRLENVTAAGARTGGAGIRVTDGPENVTIRDSAALDNDGDGIWIDAAGVTVADSTAIGNERDLATNASVSVTVDRLDVGASTAPNTTLSFVADGLGVRGTSSPPDAPDAEPLGRYVEAVVVEDAETGTLELAAHYDDADLDGIDEAALGLRRHDGDGWTAVSNATVDTAIGTVNATVAVTERTTVGVFASASGGPTEIADWHDLDAVRNDLDGEYVLVADLDRDTAGYEAVAALEANDGAGFEPIGGGLDDFNGTFDGQGHAITGLTIDRPAEDIVGLFGATADAATIRNVTLEDASVTGAFYVGGLVGINDGTIVDSSVDGNVSGDTDVGGLVADHFGTIERSSSSATVTADGFAGGLVGFSGGTVRNVSAAGDVIVSREEVDAYYAGGLIGQVMAGGTVEFATASGNVTALGPTNRSHVGGLIGDNGGAVANVYATGAVSGGQNIGGLVGSNGGNVTAAYAAGPVEGDNDVGGLVGASDGIVTDSYWDREITGQSASDGGTGLTTAEMTGSAAEAAMLGFDFEAVWSTTHGYPELAAVDDTVCIDEAVAGEDGVIDLGEIQEAIDWWATDAEVPGTGGETISLSKIQALIDAWATDEQVTC